MMQIITSLSKAYSISPFDILNKDFDDFALLVNYHLENNDDEKSEIKTKKSDSKGIKRVKVNDKTASGGWF